MALSSVRGRSGKRLDVAPELAQLIERVRLGFRRYRFSPLRRDWLARSAAFLVRSQIARPNARIDVGQGAQEKVRE